jgi:hypothetical protein
MPITKQTTCSTLSGRKIAHGIFAINKCGSASKKMLLTD